MNFMGNVQRTLASIKRGDLTHAWKSRLYSARDARTSERVVTCGPLRKPQSALSGSAVDLHQTHLEMTAFVKEFLQNRGTPFTLVEATTSPKTRIVIHHKNLTAVIEALERVLPFPHWNVISVNKNSYDISANYVDPENRLINQRESHVRIEGWMEPEGIRRPDDGKWPLHSLAAPSDAGYSVPFVVLEDQAFHAPQHSVFDFVAPVDLVYTWVDSHDPAWLERKQQALSALGQPVHPGATDSARFRSFDELRYSLRSVYTYANWVRKIHIVTDSQIPDWLDTSHPKINIVDHSEILPQSVFNSHAIESRLHHIPGLAEHYLYLNDDVFFGALVFPQDFYASESIAKFFPSDLPLDPRPAMPEDPPIMAAAKNGRDLLEQKYRRRVTFKLRHSVHPQIRSVVADLERTFPQVFEQVARSQFRAPEDISVAASMSHWYGYLTGRSVPADLDYLYVNLSQADTGKVLDALYSLRRYPTFCLNQERLTPNTEAGIREMQQFLPRYFPYPAPWELGS